MSDYDKKQARIDRYRERAEQARQQSSGYRKQFESMMSAIPMGQPIHGERDRRYRDRAGQKIEKSIEAGEKATYYEAKADAAERNTAISSDDPEAVTKLKDKLEKLQETHARMKRINAYYRKHGTCRGCEDVSDELAAKLDESMKTAYSWETAPFPSYTLSGNTQEMRRLKDRIKQLEDVQQGGYEGWTFNGGEVVANSEENRLQILFDEKPDEDLRKKLKSWGVPVGPE